MRHQKGLTSLTDCLLPGPALVWRTHRLTPMPTSCFRQSSRTHQSPPPNCLYFCSYSSLGSDFWCFLGLACSVLFSFPCLPNSTHPSMPSSGVTMPNKPSLTVFPVNGPTVSLYLHTYMSSTAYMSFWLPIQNGSFSRAGMGWDKD